MDVPFSVPSPLRPQGAFSIEMYSEEERATKKYSLIMRLGFFFQYESPKVVVIENKGLGVLRLVLHTICLCFLFFYQLMYCRGYQSSFEAQYCITLETLLHSDTDKKKTLDSNSIYEILGLLCRLKLSK